ncbi:MAG: serine hydrolase domain-containing protein [Verrucomicrobiota bacterium]
MQMPSLLTRGPRLLCACIFGLCSFFNSSQAASYATIIPRFEQAIAEELNRGSVSGLSVALVDDQQMVYSRGFGLADKKRKRPARTDTVYRCGSISKLFTALATMQLAEQGKLDIDKPLTNFLSDFRVVVPFDGSAPMTLRQLMCHRSGMVREAPVGSYFDDSEPSAAETVASLAACVLVYPTGTKTKYSNSGITVVGQTVERVSGKPFEVYQQEHLLGPLGMKSSGWRLTRALRSRLAKGYLPVARADGTFQEREAPQFEFGILPAGNLYTTAEDLGRFLSMLFAEGMASGQPLVRKETLAEMFRPQLTADTNAFGLGFFAGNFRGHRTVSHMGAVYGFTSALTAIPAQKIGVIILCNDDIAVGAVRKLNNLALGLMLEAKLGEKLALPENTNELSADELARFAGDFESESYWAKVESRGGMLQANISGQVISLRPVGPLKFLGDGRLVTEAVFNFDRDSAGSIVGFSGMNQKFRRIDPGSAEPIPAEWKLLLGSYGPDFIPLIISVRHGHLYAMTENEYDNRLTPLNRFVFKMPPGLYVDEQLVFLTDTRGRPHTAVLANIPLKRRR